MPYYLLQEEKERVSMDAPTSDIELKSGVIIEDKLDKSEQRIAPDQFDERYLTTKKEIYTFYWYDIHGSRTLGTSYMRQNILQLLHCHLGRAHIVQ